MTAESADLILNDWTGGFGERGALDAAVSTPGIAVRLAKAQLAGVLARRRG